MKKPNHPGKILQDHKKIGQKSIPPMMQINNIHETSFIDNTLPCLIWLSAIFLRKNHKLAIKHLTYFIETISEIMEDDNKPSLIFLNDIQNISEENKTKIFQKLNGHPSLEFLQDQLVHQFHLLIDYPLGFLFKNHLYGVERDEAIQMLKADVDSLLDRYSQHATIVQTTAVFLMIITGKLHIGPAIDLPDFNVIFNAPESEDAKRVAGFVRATLNGGAGFMADENKINKWANSFWQQTFSIEDCI